MSYAAADQPLSTLKLRNPVMIVTWTAAEWQALRDVLGVGNDQFDYAHSFDTFAPELTEKSPAAAAKCLARFAVVTAPAHDDQPERDVLLVHSMLHLATDSNSLPLRRLFHQMINEVNPERIITTGTAGGIGATKELGDVVVGSRCRFNCAKTFADAPWAHTHFDTTLPAAFTGDEIGPLLEVNAVHLPRTTPPKIWLGQDIETTDFFAFDESDDRFGLEAYDPGAGAVEMDDAVLGLVMVDRAGAGLEAPPLWAAVRNVSDPDANLAAYGGDRRVAAEAMAKIYAEFGYWTSVPSAIVSWLMATGSLSLS